MTDDDKPTRPVSPGYQRWVLLAVLLITIVAAVLFAYVVAHSDKTKSNEGAPAGPVPTLGA